MTLSGVMEKSYTVGFARAFNLATIMLGALVFPLSGFWFSLDTTCLFVYWLAA